LRVFVSRDFENLSIRGTSDDKTQEKSEAQQVE
jgi:hypothetical protein